MTRDELIEYSNAWNDHDIDRIMSYHTEDTVFETGGGSERFGTRFEGFAVVRERFQEVWRDIPDVRFENGSHFVGGDRGCSEWTFCGTRSGGETIEVDGCDLFTFASDGLILIKASYLKNRT